jgi:hypothetical protein
VCQIGIHAAIVSIPSAYFPCSVTGLAGFAGGFTRLRRRFAPLTEQGKYAENAMIEKGRALKVLPLF